MAENSLKYICFLAPTANSRFATKGYVDDLTKTTLIHQQSFSGVMSVKAINSNISIPTPDLLIIKVIIRAGTTILYLINATTSGGNELSINYDNNTLY